jgi:hypothetical protein
MQEKENKITIQSAFEHMDKELKKEQLRNKERYLEKWKLKSIKTGITRTALESWEC